MTTDTWLYIIFGVVVAIAFGVAYYYGRSK